MSTEQVVDNVLSPFRALFWILALPVRLFTYINRKFKVYDPEKTVCPACGYRGEKGSSYRSCTVRFIRTSGAEKAALMCTCLRCQCKYATGVFNKNVDSWLPTLVITKEEQVKQVAATRSL